MASSPSSCGDHASTEHRTVLIVDDSAVARSMIARMVDAGERYAVAGAVGNVAEAFAFLARAPVDVILLDLQMPGTDGLTAIPDLIAASGGARVLVVSSTAREGASATIEALAQGAADTLEKPGAGIANGRFARLLVERLDRLFEEPAARTPVAAPPVRTRPAARPAARTTNAAYDIVAIGASTGGIHALSLLLREIPLSFRPPILVTQHLPPTFMRHFAVQLALLGRRPCDVATDRMRIRPGRIIVAPGDRHMSVVALTDGAAIRLTKGPAASGCMPSVDPMFDGIADVYGAGAIGVVLSGMGRDGAAGAVRLHRAGGTIVVQDVATSVVWGMPGAAVAAGVADATMAPDAIGRMIAARARP